MSKGPIELPRLGAQIADTHAHLVMLDDPVGALERAVLAGVTFIIAVADVTERPEGTFEGAHLWIEKTQSRLDDWDIPHGAPPWIRIIVGAHPHNAKDYGSDSEEHLRALLRDPRVAAVGEIGLDYHYDHSPREAQQKAFRAQLALAHQLGLPAVVHLRDAHDDGKAILQEVGIPPAGCVLHCFTGGPALLEPFLEMGCCVSFAGPVTFKNANELREAAKVVPVERLLVETDCPFMAPEPHRGKSNEPAWATLTVARIADERGMDASELARAVYVNAERVLGGTAAG